MGVNQFTDLTDFEFQALYLNPLNLPPKTIQTIHQDTSSPIVNFDWQAAGKVSPIKNQGSCVSDWAFASVAAVESAVLIQDLSTDYFSEQQLVDCSGSFGSSGCDGGWVDSAFRYIAQKGISTAQQYPYVAKTQACKFDGGSRKISNFVVAFGCDDVLNALNTKPLAVGVDASRWSSYNNGIFSNCGTGINHFALLIGVTDTYWRIKNSWGVSWG